MTLTQNAATRVLLQDLMKKQETNKDKEELQTHSYYRNTAERTVLPSVKTSVNYLKIN